MIPWANCLAYAATVTYGTPVHIALLRIHLPSSHPPHHHLLVFAFGKCSAGTKFSTNSTLLAEVLEAKVHGPIVSQWEISSNGSWAEVIANLLAQHISSQAVLPNTGIYI